MLSSADLINTPTKQLGNRGEEKNRGEEQGTEEKSRGGAGSRGEEQGTERRGAGNRGEEQERTLGLGASA